MLTLSLLLRLAKKKYDLLKPYILFSSSRKILSLQKWAVMRKIFEFHMWYVRIYVFAKTFRIVGFFLLQI